MIAGTASQQTAYPVEVSGWDEHEDFFVQKTELQWSEQSGKHVLTIAADCFRLIGFPSAD